MARHRLSVPYNDITLCSEIHIIATVHGAAASVEHTADAVSDDISDPSATSTLTQKLPSVSSNLLTADAEPGVRSADVPDKSSKESAYHSGGASFGPEPKMWNAFWLYHSVLLAFCVVFAVMLIIVVTLYSISESKNGLSTQVESRHYAWTYGPTASTYRPPIILYP
jgi:hypothetical protein